MFLTGHHLQDKNLETLQNIYCEMSSQLHQHKKKEGSVTYFVQVFTLIIKVNGAQ